MGSKKKLKKKKRMGDVSVGGSTQTVLHALAQVQASHAQMAAPIAAHPAPVAAPVSIPVNTVNSVHEKPAADSDETDLDEWEDGDDEDEDDGEDSEITSADPNIETVNFTEVAVVEVQTQADQQQEVDRNIVEVKTLENENMNVVNHPQNQTAPTPQNQPIHAVTTSDTNLVPEGAMERMQQDAASVPPPAATAPAPTVSIPEADAPRAKPKAAFHNLAMTVMFTLDMTHAEHMSGLKKVLSRVPLDGQDFNLYSPFRKAGKKDTNPSAEGIMRYVLPGTLDITDAINNSRVMMVGPEADIMQSLQDAIQSTRDQIINLFPSDAETVVAELRDDEQRQTVQIQLKDIVNVRSWINSSTENEDGALVATHNAVINFVINAGALYDAEERTKFVNQIENVMQLITNNREEANTTLLLAVNLDSSSLSDPSIREFLDALLTAEEFTLYTRREMHRLEVSDFLPQTIEAVDSEALAEEGDLLLIRLLTGEEEEEAPEGGAEDETEGAGVE